MFNNLASKTLQDRFGINRTVRAHGRDLLPIGFLFLLSLIALIGYWSRRSVTGLEEHTSASRDAEVRRLRLALQMGELAGEMAPEVREEIETKGKDRWLNFPSKQRLEDLRRQMEGQFADAAHSSISQLPEFHAVESSFAALWAAVNSDDPVGQDWSGKERTLNKDIATLQERVERDAELADRQSQQLSEDARTEIGLATGGVLLVGLAVAVLTIFEINRALQRLARAYTESAESRDHLKSMLDSLVSGVVVFGADGAAYMANHTFLKENGLDGKIQGLHYTQIFQAMPQLASMVSARLDHPSESHSYCGRAQMRGRLFDTYASPLSVGGEQTGLILVFVDVTDAERAQMELLRNRALSAVGQMTAQVAHEIKNPLGSIVLALNLLRRRRGDRDEEELQVIDVIESSIEHLGSIVSELLEFSRPKEIVRTRVNLNSLIDSLLPMVADRCKSRGVQVETRYDGGLPEAAFDESELRKLFINLIINAVDASHEGGRVEVRTGVEEGGMISVGVADSGCGMDAETLRRLFEPFFTTKKNGTGLGMAIARKIAELHRGDLSVSSEPRLGTTITVRLPIEYQEEASEGGEESEHHDWKEPHALGAS